MSMTWSYEYTPLIWPILGSVSFLTVMGIYGYRNRTAPGVIPFIVLVIGVILWVLCSAMGLAATISATKIFWFKCQAVFLLPMVTAEMCFAIEYAGLGRWLTHRTIALLAVAPVVFAIFVLTDGIHHLAWTRFWISEYVHGDLGPVSWIAVVYSYFLSLIYLTVLAWLFVHSPRHRLIASLLIITPLAVRCAHFLRIANWNIFAPLDPLLIFLNFAFLPYAFALFRFNMFDVVPVARDTVIDGMSDGMIVLDNENRIVDINRPSQALLGIRKSKVIGKKAVDVLHDSPDILSLIHNPDKSKCEVSSGDGHPHWYEVYLSPLIDRRGFQLGRIIWFHDITEHKRTHAQILDQQRTLAMLKERELLARELHDGIGQMLAAAHLQVKSATTFLARGDAVQVESCLKRVAEATQDAKEFIRGYLLGVKTHFPPDQSLYTTLQQYLNQYRQDCGINVELIAHPELEEKRFDSAVETQLQPIIQEALTNVRKHSGASTVRVIFARCDGEIQIMLEDNGCGFDPAKISNGGGFGMRSMRGRAEAVGARLEVNTSPSNGTRLIIGIPCEKEML